MSQSTVELSPLLRALVDQRLDAIERILLAAGVPRGERTGILGDVESHVFDLVGEFPADHELTRRDVLDVLAKLDPPEAYAPADYRERAQTVAAAASQRSEPAVRRPKVAPLAIGAMILAICATPGAIVTVYLTIMVFAGGGDGSALLMGTMALLATLLFAVPGAVVGVLAIRAIRRSDGWLYGIGSALPGIALVPTLLLQGAVAGLMIGLAGEVALFLLAAVYVGATTAFVLHGLWHWLSHGYRVRAPELVDDTVN